MPKQAWRLLHQPNSLVSQIFKAKYYNSIEILHSSIGYKPFDTWKSIHSSLSLLKTGLIWRVSDGQRIKIWKDKWIPNKLPVYCSPKVHILEKNSTVSVLTDHSSRWWNVSLVKEIFSPTEATHILSLLVSVLHQLDKLVWNCTSLGVFFVSAYHLPQDLNSFHCGE